MLFRFDTHALFFSEDAVALETALHQRLNHKRVNLVNLRREFFYARPEEVKELLLAMGNDQVLEYNEIAEAVEWRASDPGRRLANDTDSPYTAANLEVALMAAAPQADADGDLSDDGVE